MSPPNSNNSRAAASAAGQGPVAESRRAGDAARGDVMVVAPEHRVPVSFARIDRLRDSMRGKESLIDELIDLFVADLPRRLSAIAEAIEQADPSALALQAHALRGGAANFGADRLDELCSMLEEIGRRGPQAEASAIFSQLRAESARVRTALAALRSQPSQGPPAAQAAQKSSGSSR